ncbi:MAG TPA: NUDIX hydrolase [Myxococcales bacterium]|nr:NUDIX hydrolase [Myxococcales bacterium]
MPPTPPPQPEIAAIEVIEDFTARARCDEGFLHVRRMRCRNRRSDGSLSAEYRVDVMDRPRLDAVAVLVHRRGEGGELEVLTRKNLRPAAWFRRDKSPAVPDGREWLFVDEIVAGLLEPEDRGEAGLRHRAACEVREEAGFAVAPERIRLLGAGFFVVPGILSERIYPAAVDVTGLSQEPPRGDGSPLEEGGQTRWWKAGALLAACRSGEVPDAKTELLLVRLLADL